MFEEFTKSRFPDFVFTGGKIDGELNGRPLEIKSCEEIIQDSYTTTGRRYGRFVFERGQIKALLENNGFIYFIVHSGRKVIKTLLIEAVKLFECDFSGVNKTISWRIIFSEAC